MAKSPDRRPSQRPRQRKSRQALPRAAHRWLVAAMVFAFVIVGCVAASLWDFWTPRPVANGEVVIRLRPGQPFSVAAAQLAEAGVVWSELNLKVWAYFLGVDRRVRPGEYLLRGPISGRSALEQMESGTAGYRVLTIPEGSTVEEIALLYEAAGFGTAAGFLQVTEEPSLRQELQMPATGYEGYLFPDTYHFVWADPPERMIRTMVRRFREQTAALAGEREQLGLSEHAMVTLASIIEKEAKLPEERPLISAVFHNRLRRGMRLQADPTAVYGLGPGVQPAPDHLRRRTPYNTYQNEGLPPGPICNPGLAAMLAAVRPAPVDYLYFVARGDGSHAFSRSLEEHNSLVHGKADRKSALEPEKKKRPLNAKKTKKNKRTAAAKKRAHRSR